MGQHRLRKDELIQALRRLEQELGNVPSTADMNESGEYSAPPYYRAFGSWNDALREAGFEPKKTRKPRSKEELIAELHRVAEECGDTPTKEDMAEYGDPAPDTYSGKFGSWNAALEAAGFTPRTETKRISTEDLCTALRELADEQGVPPKTSEMNQRGPYSAGTYYNRFGSWEKALDAAGIGSTS
ncbi:homing endonuclease associated repeat-containing protein [Halorubrum trueperi]|uniref:Homing endonuclease associated repeat-containing protein n=1 Tax=Halorubrum trueperi TaxID=2004704 RepID=A0ABD5ULD3_9EURY